MNVPSRIRERVTDTVAHGSLKSYGSTGVVNGSVGAAVGAGVEVGLIRDVRSFYGDGYQLSIATPSPFSVNLSFTLVLVLFLWIASATGASWLEVDAKVVAGHYTLRRSETVPLDRIAAVAVRRQLAPTRNFWPD